MSTIDCIVWTLLKGSEDSNAYLDCRSPELKRPDFKPSARQLLTQPRAEVSTSADACIPLIAAIAPVATGLQKKSMTDVRSPDDLYIFISYVVLCAPDRFPQRDHLPPDQQMTLGRAFARMRSGIDALYPGAAFAAKRRRLNAALDEAVAAYERGDGRAGAGRLQDFQDLISESA